jgi:hypothetical protein
MGIKRLITNMLHTSYRLAKMRVMLPFSEIRLLSFAALFLVGISLVNAQSAINNAANNYLKKTR